MCTILHTAVGQLREEGNRCYYGCSKILPTKSTSISAVRLSYTYARTFALYGAGTPKQDACFKKNQKRVIASFIGWLTLLCRP